MSYIPERPLLFFDLETTGINAAEDRIVEIATVKLLPDGSRKVFTKRINPKVPIPKEASAVHGITNEMVKNEKSFEEIGEKLYHYIEGCDLAGYNMISFDLPLLQAEFKRIGIDYNVSGLKLLDMFTVYRKMVKRNLSNAYRFYCGKELLNAHSAEADILATEEIFQAQLQFHEGLEDANSFHEACQNNDVDKSGKLKWNDEGEIVIAFGKKYAKVPLKEVIKKDRGYIDWVISSEFPEDTKQICKDALMGKYPARSF